MQQSRKVLWVVLSARSSKKFERMAREATDICLRVLKELATKVCLTATVVRNSVLIISHITFQIVACTFLATTFLEKTVYIIICKFFAT